MKEVLIILLCLTANGQHGAQNAEQAIKTEAVKNVPFCSLILQNVFDDSFSFRQIDVLMPPELVTEDNLAILFKELARQNPHPFELIIWVHTNVRQLASIATGWGPHEIEEGNYQWAVYNRSERVELFRYNPDYPREGSRTVIIRGKE